MNWLVRVTDLRFSAMKDQGDSLLKKNVEARITARQSNGTKHALSMAMIAQKEEAFSIGAFF